MQSGGCRTISTVVSKNSQIHSFPDEVDCTCLILEYGKIWALNAFVNSCEIVVDWLSISQKLSVSLTKSLAVQGP